MRSTILDAWAFLLGDHPDAWKKNADETAFRPVRVPHDWAVEHPFDRSHSSGTGYLPGGIGWYRARCSVADLGLRQAASVRLVFHGVYKNAQVWVNGYHQGSRPSGYAEFAFDLTEILAYAPDDDLVISVRVDHEDLADSRWYNGSGITRLVEIQAYQAVSIAPHGTIVTTLSADRAAAQVEVVQKLQNHTDVSRRVTVDHALVPLGDRRPDPVYRGLQSTEVPARGSADLRTVIDVADPLRWSDDHPHLYQLVTSLAAEGLTEPSSRDVQVVGIRTFEFDADAGFSINGVRRVLKGVCLHEDAGCFGTAVPAEVWLRRLLLLKRAGCNAVRMAHNPHAPELYDLCDLLGLYVIDEAFDEWENPKNKWWQGHNVYPPKHDGYAHHYPEWHVRDLETMIDTHRHHPSVIAWSVGNEVDYPNDPYASESFAQMTGNNDANKPESERRYDPDRPDIRRLTSLANELIDIVKARDASRPVTLAAAFPELSSTTGLLDRLDLIGYNYKEHLYAEDHRRFPEQPLVGSENSHSYEAWRHVVDADYVAGQFLWTGIDYLGETPGWPSHGSGAGLLTTAGFCKERWHLRRSWWADEPVMRLAVRPAGGAADPHRPFGRNWIPGTKVEVACFTNADDVTVRYNWEPITMVFDSELGYWRGTVTLSRGVVIAEGDVEGVMVRDELRHRQPATALAATVWEVPESWRTGLARITRGRPVVHQLECRLVDEHGRDAAGETTVTAEVSGGDLVGLDNGDLCDITSYHESHRSTSDGKLMVYLRGPGATVTLRAPGLRDLVVAVPTD